MPVKYGCERCDWKQIDLSKDDADNVDLEAVKYQFCDDNCKDPVTIIKQSVNM